MILNKVSSNHPVRQSEILQPELNRRPVTRAPNHKQALILAAARSLFTEQGFSRTSTQQIAQRAGVSEGIVFHHFGSKKKLLARVAENFAAEAAAASMPEDTAAMTEESVVRAAFEFADTHYPLYKMLERDGMAVEALTGQMQNDIIIATIADQLADAMAAHEIRQTNPKILAELQFAVVDAAYRAWRRTNDPSLREDYIHEAIDCMQAMLRKT